MSDLIDDLREKLTGWRPGKSQASGKGGDRRQRAIDDAVSDNGTGDPNTASNAGAQAQSTDNQNRY